MALWPLYFLILFLPATVATGGPTFQYDFDASLLSQEQTNPIDYNGRPAHPPEYYLKEDDLYDQLPEMRYFGTNIHCAKYIYLTWMSDLDKYKQLMRHVQDNLGYLNRRYLLYWLAGISDDEFQEDSKDILAGYRNSIFCTDIPSGKLRYKGKYLRLSSFKPRKEFKSSTLRTALDFAILDPPAIKLWPQQFQRHIAEFTAVLNDSSPRIFEGELVGALSEVFGIDGAWLNVAGFLNRFRSLQCPRENNVKWKESELNIALLLLLDDVNYSPPSIDSAQLPSKLESPLIIQDGIFWDLANQLEKPESIRFLLQVGLHTGVLTRSIKPDTSICSKIYKVIAKIPDLPAKILYAAARAGYVGPLRRILHFYTPHKSAERIFAHYLSVFCDARLYAEYQTNGLQGLENLPNDFEALDMRSQCPFKTIARLMMVPCWDLMKMNEILSNDLIQWVVDNFPISKVYTDLFHQQRATQIILTLDIKEVLGELWSREGNEETSELYLGRIESLSKLPFHQTCINHKTLMTETGLAFEDVGETDPYSRYLKPIVKRIGRYWFIIDVSRQFKVHLVTPGSYVRLDGSKYYESFKFCKTLEPSSCSLRANFESISDAMTVLKPLIAKGILNVPTPDHFRMDYMYDKFYGNKAEILDFKLFLDIVVRCRANNEERLLKVLGDADDPMKPVLDVLAAGGHHGEMIASILGVPSFQIQYELEPAIIFKFDDSVIVQSKTKHAITEAPCQLESDINKRSSITGLTVSSNSQRLKFLIFLLRNEIIQKFPLKSFFYDFHGNESDLSLSNIVEAYATIKKLFKDEKLRQAVIDGLEGVALNGADALVQLQLGCDIEKIFSRLDFDGGEQPKDLINAVLYGAKAIEVARATHSMDTVHLQRRLVEALERIGNEELETDELKLVAMLLICYDVNLSEHIQSENSELFEMIRSLCNKIVSSVENNSDKICDMDVDLVIERAFSGLTVKDINSFAIHPLIFRAYLKSIPPNQIEQVIEYVFFQADPKLWQIIYEAAPPPSYPLLQKIHANPQYKAALKFIKRHYKHADLLKILLFSETELTEECPLYDLFTAIKAFNLPEHDSLLQDPSIIDVILDWVQVSYEPFPIEFLEKLVGHCFSSSRFLSLWSKVSKLLPFVRPRQDCIHHILMNKLVLCCENLARYYPRTELPSWILIAEQFITGTVSSDIMKSLDGLEGFSRMISSKREKITQFYPEYCTHFKSDPETLKVLHWLGQVHQIYPPREFLLTFKRDRRYDMFMLFTSLAVDWSAEPFKYMSWNSKVSRDDIVGSSMYLLQDVSLQNFSVSFEGEPAIDSGGPSGEWATLVIEALLQDQSTFPRYKPTNSDESFPFPTLNRSDPCCVAKLKLFALVHAVALRKGRVVEGEMAPICYQKLIGQFPTFSFDELGAVDGENAYALDSLRQLDEEGLEGEGLVFRSGAAVTKEDLETYISQQVEEFFEGFLIYCHHFQLFTDHSIQFSAKTLRQRLHGSSNVTPAKIVQSINIYGLGSVVLQNQFREALERLDHQELQTLLMLWTGSKRLSVNGSNEPQLKIGSEIPKNGIPTASTCFNKLYLGPEYSSVEHLVRALRTFMEHAKQYTHG